MTDLAEAWTGGLWGSVARCVLASNPSPMTLDGTNTWILARPGAGLAVVVDPGPAHEGHLADVHAAVQSSGAEVGLVLLTHGHPDHAEGADRFAEITGAEVRSLAHGTLADGEVVEVDGLELHVVATPGHTADSLSFLLSEEGGLLTGDTLLGRGSTVIAYPDGKLADYLDSLDRLGRLAGSGSVSAVLPGHGPVLADPGAAIDAYRAHRRERLAQVRAAVEAGARTSRSVVELVYADVDRALWPAAELSVRAQLEYLGVHE